VDLPLADSLSRLYPPYKAAFTDRHLRYPDLRRENIIMPPEWIKTPNTILTTTDILRSMHDQIVFVEKSSSAVKNKRLRALVAEIAILYDELTEDADTLVEQIHGELAEIEATAKGMDKHTGKTTILMDPLTAVSPKVLITPHFLVKHQNENPRLHGIITQLRTIPRDNLKPIILSRYRLLNDSILVTRNNKKLPFEAQSNIRIVCDTRMSWEAITESTLWPESSPKPTKVITHFKGLPKWLHSDAGLADFTGQPTRRQCPLAESPFLLTPSTRSIWIICVSKRICTGKARRLRLLLT
jgi:hypothetical protein